MRITLPVTGEEISLWELLVLLGVIVALFMGLGLIIQALPDSWERWLEELKIPLFWEGART